MGAKPGSVLPTVASKTGILYAPMVERCKTPPFRQNSSSRIFRTLSLKDAVLKIIYNRSYIWRFLYASYRKNRYFFQRRF